MRATISILAALMLLAPAAAAAQSAGTTGASVLELPAGSRATGFAGAYVAGSDVDALFYNPAGAARVDAGFGLAYQRYVADVAIGSAAGALRLGPVVLGAAVQYLDGGDIDVIEPDPTFGGERGRETGTSASAGETALRLAISAPLLGDRLSVGLAAGYVSRELANYSDNGAFFDVGAQYVALDHPAASPVLMIGVSARNLGGALSDDALDAALPAEARIGAAATLPVRGDIGVVLAADLLQRLEGEGSALMGGFELGILPGAQREYTAVARAGYSNAAGSDGLGGNLHLGAGLGFGPWALDYTWQSLDVFGAVHRFGIRWSR